MKHACGYISSNRYPDINFLWGCSFHGDVDAGGQYQTAGRNLLLDKATQEEKHLGQEITSSVVWHGRGGGLVPSAPDISSKLSSSYSKCLNLLDPGGNTVTESSSVPLTYGPV